MALHLLRDAGLLHPCLAPDFMRAMTRGGGSVASQVRSHQPKGSRVEEIMEAVGVLQAGGREQARRELLALWDKWSGSDAPRERCTIAHFLADTEEEPGAELEWDLRALEAATGTREAEDRPPVDSGMDGFLPSLHLNVGDACRRVGEPERARRHAEIGLVRARALDDDGYGKTIRQGLERLLARLSGDS